jgi:hypothetical protein
VGKQTVPPPLFVDLKRTRAVAIDLGYDQEDTDTYGDQRIADRVDQRTLFTRRTSSSWTRAWKI